MRFCFIVPPSPWLIEQATFPPLGIGYLSGVLKQHGHEVEVVDLALGHQLPKHLDVDVIGYTGTTQHFPIVYELYKKLSKQYSDTLHVIGGPHASSLPRQCHRLGFDYVVIGEGENGILKLVKNYPASGLIIEEAPVANLDSIPFPDWEAIHIQNYKYEIDGAKATIVITSRGCPFKCAFCCKVWSRTVRFRSPENVMEEVRTLKENYDYEGIMFFDDTFILDKKRVWRLCELLKPLNIVWRAETRLIDDVALLQQMYNSGCRELAIGVESGSNQILKVIEKDITVEQAKKTVELCHKVGIRVKAFLMIGLPGESKETVEATRHFIQEAQPDDIDYSIYFPYPKSTIYDEKERFDIQFDIDYSKRDWMKFFEWGKAVQKGMPGEYKSVVRTSNLSQDEIVRLRDEVEGEFKVYNSETRRFIRLKS